ncbi:MAG: hypothetical protein KDD66_05285 [Bdellovibrionales bacterium]|nr:hypothetical protein [Bdellovibrionales bacterium]
MSVSLTAGDRVVRNGTTGPLGTVQKVRVERIRESLKENLEGKEPPGVTITVLWDNGTSSHFVPHALSKVD